MIETTLATLEPYACISARDERTVLNICHERAVVLCFLSDHLIRRYRDPVSQVPELAAEAPAWFAIPNAIHAGYLESKGLVLEAASTLYSFTRRAFSDVRTVPQRHPVPKTTGSVTATEAELASLENRAHLMRYMLLHSGSSSKFK